MVSDDYPTRRGAARATDQYGPVFVMVLAILWLAMFIEESRPVRVFVGLAVIIVVLGTLRAAGVIRRTMRIALLIAAALGGLVASGGYTDKPGIVASIAFAVAAALAVAVLALLRRIFEQTRIGLSEIVAALTAYLQIALVFSFIFGGVAELADGDFFRNGISGQAGDFTYFSVVTLTTLGYGDFSPATNIGRSLAMSEALLGQIFLIVLVAYLVGMLGRSRTTIGRKP
jgi:hypothetical protein